MKDDHREPASNSDDGPKDALTKDKLHHVPSSETVEAVLPLERCKVDESGNGKSEPPIASRKDTYKETITMVKDTLDVAWKMAPVALLPAALFVWIHLRSIHWTSLFQDSAMSGSGLIFLFVAAMLIAVAVLLQFIIPSLSLIGALWNYRQESILPKAIPQLFYWATGGWFVGFALVVMSGMSQFWIILAGAFLAALAFGIYSHKSLGIPEETCWKLPLSVIHAVGLALAAMFALTTTSIPLLITLHVVVRYADGGLFEKFLVLAVCLGTTVVCMLPGFMYLNARTWRSGFYQPLKLAFFGGFLISYIIMSGAVFFVPISSPIMRLAGIYSNEPQSFQILQPSLTAALSAANVPIHKGEQTNIVVAYVRYNFGGIRLLCRESFNPTLVSDDALKLARDKKATDPTVFAGSGCVQATSSELRPLRM